MNDNLYPSAVSDAKQSAETVTEQLGLNIKLLTWDRLFAAVISLIVCVIAIHLIMRVLRRVVDRSRLSEALGRFLLRLCRIALDFVTILIVAGSLGFDVTALLAVFSLLGLALTLSIQNSLSNLMSGIVILVTKPFTVGEYIESGGVAGTVRDIGLFYTQMTTLDNKAIYVPNSELSATKIINYTREPNRRVDLIFGAGYDYPTETVLFAVKQEHGDERVADFQTLLRDYIHRDADMWLLTDEMPTLDEARGKLVLLRRYADEGSFGIDGGLALIWQDQGGYENFALNTVSSDNGSYTLWVQDRFEYDTEHKWTAFLGGLRTAPGTSEECYINFLSTKGTAAYGHPYSFAKTLNARLLDQPLTQGSGWIIVDFGTAPLAEHVYSANF